MEVYVHDKQGDTGGEMHVRHRPDRRRGWFPVHRKATGNSSSSCSNALAHDESARAPTAGQGAPFAPPGPGMPRQRLLSEEEYARLGPAPLTPYGGSVQDEDFPTPSEDGRIGGMPDATCVPAAATLLRPCTLADLLSLAGATLQRAGVEPPTAEEHADAPPPLPDD